MDLRPYQHQAVGDVRAAFQRHRRVLLVAPTGSGKTVIFCHLAEAVQARGKRVVLLAHRIEIVDQIGAALVRAGVRHGWIVPGRPLTDHPVQVAMVQTLAGRAEGMEPPDLLVVDEAHHATAGSYRKITEAWGASKILGVTASPSRTDGTGLGECFDAMVAGPSMRELITQGYLSDFTCYAPPRVVDLSGVKIRAGDYARDELAAAMDKAAITGDAVKHYARHLAGKPAIAFCASVEHAEHVAMQFLASGFQAASLDGKMHADLRRARIEAIGTGALHVLTSCDLVSEGTDIPAVAGALLLRPTQSIIVYLQQVGRVLRPAPGKERAIILDHVGNVVRFGLPDAARHWSLASTKRRGPPDAPPVRQCPRCFACHAPAMRCPACQHVYAAAREPTVYPAGSGDLVAVPAGYNRLRDAPLEDLVRAARTLDQLHDIGRARGYASGWAWKMWQRKRARFAKRPTPPLLGVGA